MISTFAAQTNPLLVVVPLVGASLPLEPHVRGGSIITSALAPPLQRTTLLED
jgi:hypothetical protein